MSDKYYRLVTFLVDIDTSVLRTLFVETARTDTSIGTPFTTIHAYVQARKPTIDKLLKKRKIRQDQYELIYPSAGTTDVNTWDISLLCALLTGLFGKTLNAVRTCIEVIRMTRNKLQHAAGTAQLTDIEFNTMWTDLKQATKVLARTAKDHVYEGEIEREIDDSMINCMPKLGDILRTWYMDFNAEQLSSMKRTLDDIDDRSKTSSDILENVVVKTSNASGECVKKIKTADQTAIHLRECFRKTIIRELPEDFIPPPEVIDIHKILCDKHMVMITGYANTPYLATALYAIQSKYHREKCVLLSDGQKWAHIDPEETDLVLFKNPFGETSFDKERSRNMFEAMDSVLMTVRDASRQMDVVIVSRAEIVPHIQQYMGHWPDDLMDCVTLCAPTTVDKPINVDRDAAISCSSGKQFDVLRNLQDLTAMVLQRQHVQVSDDVVRQAKEAMRIHKVVVLTGKNRDIIDAVVSKISQSYNIEECLLLHHAEDIKYLSPSRVSLLVANYITGEYVYDCVLTRAWFTSLRMLEAVVHQGKLNVIITAYSEENLNEALSQYGQHSMLTFRVKVPSTMVSKMELESSEDRFDAESKHDDNEHERVGDCQQSFHQLHIDQAPHEKNAQETDNVPGGVTDFMDTEDEQEQDSNSTYKTLAAFTIDKKIGRGQFCSVYRVKCKTTGNIFALKAVQVDKIDTEKVFLRSKKDSELLQKLNHLNVVKYFGSFMEDGVFHIVLELADAGDLARMLKHFRKQSRLIPEKTIWKYFKQVCDGLAHVHSHRIIHRDIKPANVFITAQGIVKLGDLDISINMGSQIARLATSPVGTPYYMSPERLSEKPYGFEADIWSLGCLLYETAAGHSPFKKEKDNLYSWAKRIMAIDYIPLSHDIWSEQLRSLVTSCLSVEPKHRPDIHSVQALANKAFSDIRNAVAISNNDGSKNNTTATAATN